MDIDYTIKNFRTFKKDGVTCKIRPITILTGCNSSGKSSIVKSMVLLNNYGKNISKLSYYLPGTKLDFTQSPNSSMGNFKKILNETSGSDIVSYTIKCHSLLFGEDVFLTLDFGPDKNDRMNNGYLKSISLKNKEGKIVYSSSKEEYKRYDFNLIIPNFYRFINGQYLIYLYRFKLEPSFDHSEEEYSNSLLKRINDWKECFDKVFAKEAICDIRQWCDLSLYPYNLLKGQGVTSKVYIANYLKSVDHPVIPQEYPDAYLFYVPILEELKDGSAKEVSNVFAKYSRLKNYDKDYDCMIERVMNSFRNSGFQKFIDYFRSLEKTALVYVEKSDSQYAPSTFNASEEVLYSNCMAECKRFKLTPEDGDDYYSESYYKEYETEWLQKPVTFADLITLLTYFSALKSDQKYFKYGRGDGFSYKYEGHIMFEMLKQYASDLINDVLSNVDCKLDYVSSSVIETRRLYSLESNDAFSTLLKDYLEELRIYSDQEAIYVLKGTEFKPGSFINKWFKAFGAGDHVNIDVSEEGLGVSVMVFNRMVDMKGESLSEKGYGITQLFMILLRIEVSIMRKTSLHVVKDKHALYGKSYIKEGDEYPSYVPEGMQEKIYTPNTIAIEEPEVHLHPKYQSLLADMFIDAYTNYNVQFIIETHSEYLVRRFQVLVACKKINNEDCSLEYFNDANTPEGGERVRHIKILGNGKLSGSFGSGFFDEADHLSMDLLKS